MSKIINIGMNHKTAPVELRECLAKEPEDSIKALSILRDIPCIKEGVYLSTCNRIECICSTEAVDEAKDSIVSLLSRLGSISEDRFTPNLYTYEGAAAVRHVFRVASSLDSMVIGEPQILGQLKHAYLQATQQKMSGAILNRLMHKAFHVAKRIRTETGIADAAVSISYAAVELSKKIFYDLEDKTVLLVGAGEMAELTARHLMTQGARTIHIANRTFQRAIDLAKEFKGTPVSFEEIQSLILEVDIVISSTASPDYVVTHKQVRAMLKRRRNRPLFFIDIAVPRDIEPTINKLDNVYVYDIDDLKGVIEVNKSQREQESVKAERIVEEESIKFDTWLKTLDVVPTIRSIREKAEAIRQAELKKSLSGLGPLTSKQREALENMSISIAQKIINDPILFIKGKAHRPSRDEYLDMAKKLFKLNNDNEEEEKQK